MLHAFVEERMEHGEGPEKIDQGAAQAEGRGEEDQRLEAVDEDDGTGIQLIAG
jgi:hypothetical protein